MLFAKKWLRHLIMVSLVVGCQIKKPVPVQYTQSSSILITDPVVHRDSLSLRQNLGLLFYQTVPFTGVAALYHENGLVAETTTYINGKKNGYKKKWFRTGLLSYQAFYESNKLHGEVKSWWSNGVLRSSSNFQQGVADGVQKQWYSHGQLFKELHLTNGKEEGLQRAWRENGKLFANYQAKDGRIYGLKKANLCYELSNENILLDE